jgi:hypothetical protein
MINTEFLITGTGSMMAVGGVMLCAWAVRGRWREGEGAKRGLTGALGALMAVVGLYIAMKSYIEDSGWGQWVRSAMDWVLPLLGTTLIVVGGVVAIWAGLSDRSLGRKRCPRCWYDMDAVKGLVCPECGKAGSEKKLLRTRRHWRGIVLGLLLAAVGCGRFAEPWYQRGTYLKWIPTRLLIYGLPSYKGTGSRELWELERRLTECGGHIWCIRGRW